MSTFAPHSSVNPKKDGVWLVYQAFVFALRHRPSNAATVLCPPGTIQALSRRLDLDDFAVLAELHVQEAAGIDSIIVLDDEDRMPGGHQVPGHVSGNFIRAEGAPCNCSMCNSSATKRRVKR